MYNYCYMRTRVEFSVVVYWGDVETQWINVNTKSPVLGTLLLLVLDYAGLWLSELSSHESI